jgi:hypothetical protein
MTGTPVAKSAHPDGLPDALSQDDIDTAVRSHQRQLSGCAAEQAEMDPRLHGTLKIRWTILPNGSVTGVKNMSPNLTSSYLVACVGQEIAGWRFPRHHTQGPPVTYPFRF